MLQNSLAALVGRSAVSDVTLTGNCERVAGADDETGTFTYKALGTGGSRYDFSYPSGPLTEIRPPLSAEIAGAWSGPDNSSGPIAAHNLLGDVSIFPVFAIGRLNSTQTFVVTFVGQETKNGLTLYHLSTYQQFPQQSGVAAALNQHLTQTDIFLDPATWLPVAVDFYTHPDDNALVDISVEIVFSNYHQVNGVQVPFHVQKYLNNSLSLDLQIQLVVLNSGISATTFQAQ